MNSRLWYPQLDVFDTARRISIVLQHFETPPGFERLCIVDFFLANPPLLYSASMPSDVRQQFRELGIQRPEASFLSYPEPALLFHKMEPIQKEAINALLGKGIVSMERAKSGYFSLTDYGKQKFPLEQMCSAKEKRLCSFLALSFAKQDEEGNKNLRQRTGLRRAI